AYHRGTGPWASFLGTAVPGQDVLQRRPAAVGPRANLGELDENAVRLLRVEEDLTPPGVGQVQPVQPVAAPGQLGHGGVDVAHVEVEVVHAAPAPCQLEEAVEERRAGQRLHQLDLAAVGVGELQGAVSGGQV